MNAENCPTPSLLPERLEESAVVRFALPKGRMQASILTLLNEAGLNLRGDGRGYRPTINLPNFHVKILKPQNIVEMLHLGSRDLGFAGADWVAELQADLVELLDTELDPVQIVAAAPEELVNHLNLPTSTLTAPTRRFSCPPRPQPFVVASEYLALTQAWIKEQHLSAICVRSYGATEVFPPEDADFIVDNTATGSTLTANRLQIIATLMQSSTRLYANPRSLEIPTKRRAIDAFILLLSSVLEARKRVMLEVNVSASCLETVVKTLPGMLEATISPLHGQKGYAVKAAVKRSLLPSLIPEIKANGGTDLVISNIAQLVP